MSAAIQNRAERKLREFVSVAEHMADAVWYDGKDKCHPAVSPLMEGFAHEIKMQFPKLFRPVSKRRA